MNLRTILLLLIGMTFACQSFAQLKRAERKYGQLAYAGAIKAYEKHLKTNPTDAAAIARLADCYRRINDFKNAEIWFSRAVKSRKADPINYFYYGQALMNNQKWEQAVPWFEKYQEAKPDDPVGNAMLESCRNYRSFMEDSTLYNVVTTNINTAEADFSPNIWNGKVIFASARDRDRLLFGWTARPFLQLFAADYYGKPELGEPEKMKGRVNSKLHEAHVTFSPDGETMFFSRNNIIKGKIGKSSEGIIRLKTYRSDLKKGKWKEVEGIPFNDDEYSVGHPALTPDGKMMYFASDMPGGEGGTDLYVVTLDIENHNWGKPMNLGPEVNTPGNEMFPWVAADGTLYYSSNGKKGLGGLDLFRALNLNTSEPQIINMGYPINSARDDFALVLDPKRGMGFFSSNRANGKGDDDIYSFVQKQRVKGVVVDAATGERLENAKVEVYDARSLTGTSRTNFDGEFKQGLDVNQEFYAVASKEGYAEGKKRFSSKGVNINDEIVVEIPLTKSKDCPQPMVFEGTLRDDDGKPLPKRKVKVIEVEKVIETDENGLIVTELDPTKTYEFVYDGPELKEPLVKPIDTKDLIPLDTARAELVLDSPDPGDVFYIIYYDFDMYNIRNRDARPELDRVVRFMEANPDVTIQLGSHTDCRGTDQYNVTLSKNRAIEAYEYITTHGVSKNRLTYKWFGEHELSNKCADGVDCDEDMHQRNRRTEFMITGRIDNYTD